MKKAVSSAAEAVADIRDGATILMGGFGLCGLPENLIAALRDKGTRDLTLVSNNAGTDEHGIGLLLKNGQVRRMIMSYGGECKAFEDMALSGKLEVEWNPQGTLAERLRAGGAGIAGFYTPTGVGTPVAAGKETRQFDGRTYLFETGLKADFAFIKAFKGDPLGNLQFRKTSRNFNAVMATAAKVTIAEVEQLVGVGDLDPDSIHTPGIFVKRIFQGASYKKPIEKRTVRSRTVAAAALLLFTLGAVAGSAPRELRAADTADGQAKPAKKAGKPGATVLPKGYEVAPATAATPTPALLPIADPGQPATGAGIRSGTNEMPPPDPSGGTQATAIENSGVTQAPAEAGAKDKAAGKDEPKRKDAKKPGDKVDSGNKSGGQGQGGGQDHGDKEKGNSQDKSTKKAQQSGKHPTAPSKK